ncbi:MAG: hypothetical protein JO197_13150 [Acidobacteria bacterium]|nr:hypothetical protein [Acidobacteriota bacterium]MBV9477641.1 hypothetical protein [Acidobacteriota bacterium]
MNADTTARVVQFLSGSLAAGYLVAGLFFLRFWRETRDRLFGYFATAFFILSLQRVLLTLFTAHTALYVVRLAAFVLILWAIAEKNRGR